MIVKPSLDQLEIGMRPTAPGTATGRGWFDDLMDGLMQGMSSPVKCDWPSG